MSARFLIACFPEDVWVLWGEITLITFLGLARSHPSRSNARLHKSLLPSTAM